MEGFTGTRPSDTPKQKSSMEKTYRCMIRKLLKLKYEGNSAAIKSFLSKRPTAFKREIVKDCKQQWEAGNRGHDGVWL